MRLYDMVEREALCSLGLGLPKPEKSRRATQPSETLEALPSEKLCGTWICCPGTGKKI